MNAVTNDGLHHLLAAAESGNADITDRWQKTLVRFDPAIGLEALGDLATYPHLTVEVELGDQRRPVRLGAKTPDAHDRAVVQELSDHATDVAAAATAGSGLELVGLVTNWVEAAVVTYQRAGWARTFEGLQGSVSEDWPAVAASLETLDRVTVGNVSLRLEYHDESRGVPIAVPVDSGPEDSDEEALVRLLTQVADAAAWTNVAPDIERTPTQVYVSLHREQPPAVPVTLETAVGGLDLYRWLTATADANRAEALRHVLQTASLTATETLPDARAVRELSEQQRIALSRDNAAAVQRAISESHEEATRALQESAEGIAEVIGGSIRGVNGAIVAVLGIIALAGRTATTLPWWLIWLVAGVAVVGLGVVSSSEVRRLSDQELRISRARRRIEDNPLTPEGEKARALVTLDEIDVRSRARAGRLQVLGPTLAASAIVFAAAVWLSVAPVAEPAEEPLTPPSNENDVDSSAS